MSCLPVLVLAMGTTLTHMLRADTAPGHGTRRPAANWSAARSREDWATIIGTVTRMMEGNVEDGRLLDLAEFVQLTRTWRE